MKFSFLDKNTIRSTPSRALKGRSYSRRDEVEFGRKVTKINPFLIFQPPSLDGGQTRGCEGRSILRAPAAEQELGAGQVQALQQQGEEPGPGQSFVRGLEAHLELVRLLLSQVRALGQLDVPLRPEQASGRVAEEPRAQVQVAVGEQGGQTGEPEDREEGAGRQGAEQDSADEGGGGR